MVLYKVAPGRLLRHRDYSVRGYPGDVIPDTDTAVIGEPDLFRDMCITSGGIPMTPNPGGGGQASNGAVGSGSSAFVWSTIPPLNALDRQIHVDAATGVDTGNWGSGGGRELTPYATIAYAKNDLRNNFGDRLMLKRGQTHTGSLFPLAYSGYSADRPLIVGAYGNGTRPIVDSTTTPFYQNSFETPVAHIWFIGIEMTSSTYTGLLAEQQKALVVTWTADDILVEDCYIHNYGFGIDFEAHDPGSNPNPRHTNMRVRGCTIADIYVNSLATQSCSGLYASGVDNLQIEQCAFIACGWTQAGIAFASTFKHAVYVHAGYLDGDPASGCSGVICKNNICIAADGFTIRPGGIITGNVIARSMSGIQVGMGDTAQDGGITFAVEDNVMLELQSYDQGIVTIGLAVGNITASSTCARNIVANTLRNQAVSDVRALWFRAPDFEADGVTPCTRIVAAPLALTDNILYHAGTITVPNSAGSYTAVTTLTNNDFQTDDTASTDEESIVVATAAVIEAMVGSGNNFFQSGTHEVDQLWLHKGGVGAQDIDVLISDIGDATATKVERAYPDAARNLDSYAVSIGLANQAALEGALRTRSRSTWNTAHTAEVMAAYIRAGFGR